MSFVVSTQAVSLPNPSASLADFAAAFRGWLAENTAVLGTHRHPVPGTMAEVFAHEQELRRLLWDAGWTRCGWPPACGGLGGDPLLRGVVLEELAAAGYSIPESCGLAEVIGPTLLHHAPALHGELESMLRGDEFWCQGFSEPEAGSDLASLRTRATRDGERWVLNGQKIWTSRGHIARRILLLARTGTTESRHRGLSMFLVDLDNPAITVRPIPCADGREALSEVFFDDAAVPADALIGERDGGWSVAMYLLQFERGNFAWQRQAWLRSRLVDALGEPGVDGAGAAEAVGEAFMNLLALRATSLDTLRRLVAGEQLGPAISVVKVLLSTTDKAVLDAARALMWPRFEIGDEPEIGVWRQEWWFSRMASVLGGTVEVQRDIIANRVLALPKE